MGQMIRGYVGGIGTQIHYRMATAARGDAPTLICFHPVPSSGVFFETFAAAFDGAVNIVAPDMVGYGGSDPSRAPLSLEQHAAALQAIVDQAVGATQGPVTLLGYHTGALIAAELAIANPHGVSQLVLPAIPYFIGEARREKLAQTTQNQRWTETLDDLERHWALAIGRRRSAVPFARAYQMFIEAARTADRSWWGYKAGFEYEPERRFPLVCQPALCMAFNDSLSQPTRDAAAVLPNADLIEMAHLSPGAFETDAPELARRVSSAVGLVAVP